MDIKTLERLSSWLRCYPVAGREDERKSLQLLVERELGLKFNKVPVPTEKLKQYTDFRGTEALSDPRAEDEWPSAEFENGDNVEGMP